MRCGLNKRGIRLATVNLYTILQMEPSPGVRGRVVAECPKSVAKCHTGKKYPDVTQCYRSDTKCGAGKNIRMQHNATEMQQNAERVKNSASALA
jgi:hypothetical protein